MAHTKEKWLVKQTNTDLRITHIELLQYTGWWITVYSVDEVPLEDHQARCRLIVAAPDLLEELEKMVNGKGDAIKARLTIAKAKGE